MAPLQFAPWSSDIELSFYSALASLKINHDKLDDAARKIVGRYEVRPGDAPARSARMQIHGNAFTVDELPIGFYRGEGILRNMNTIEEYKALDRAAIVERAGRTIWDAILDGTIYSCPSLLSSFYAIFFADLKKYKFTYEFAFPAIHSDPPWKIDSAQGNEFARLAAQESAFLFDAFQTWKYAVDTRQHGFFLAKRDRDRFRNRTNSVDSVTDDQDTSSEGRSSRPQTPRTPKAEDFGFQWVVGSLSTYESGFFDGVDAADRFVCFVDPSNYDQNPGWMLRNLLVLVRQKWLLDEVQILCYRDTHQQRDKANSLILNLKNSDPEASKVKESETKQPVMPKVTGRERDENNKLTSRVVDLAEYLDPKRLADQSVDLNLKLMKWRIAPNLDLDTVKNTKCLLLGAGTLGSYVARNLLGWGVRKITFIDNAKVSFSNPVRQPLFAFKDCVDGGAKKAVRAAEMLEEIYPGVEARGVVMSVPMAGHPITDEQTTKKDFEQLQKLIDEHDAIFLLMDSRESRWLPTVMGKSADKIVVNAALGFDSYVVMRHGGNPWIQQRNSQQSQQQQPDPSETLGCYFCNDVVAPADSLKDQTLDQQCTVTRPGVAAIASALLVELLVSLLQHPLRTHAPAPPATSPRAAPRSPPDHPLGLIPHSIRGYLASWDNLLVRGPAYDRCSACSGAVVGAFERDGWRFVRRALNEPGFVEELSGLAEVQRLAEEAAAGVEWESEGDEEGLLEEEGELL